MSVEYVIREGRHIEVETLPPHPTPPLNGTNAATIILAVPLNG
jgi:hypothetical protein